MKHRILFGSFWPTIGSNVMKRKGREFRDWVIKFFFFRGGIFSVLLVIISISFFLRPSYWHDASRSVDKGDVVCVLRQVLVSLAAAFSLVAYGMSLGFPAISLQQLIAEGLSEDDASWFGKKSYQLQLFIPKNLIFLRFFQSFERWIHPYVPEIRTNMNTKIFGNTNKCIFFLVLSSYMFRHCRLIQEACTKIALKRISISRLLNVYCKPRSSEAVMSDIILVISSKNAMYNDLASFRDNILLERNTA